MNLHIYQTYQKDYDHLSLKDLVDALNLYHAHLIHYPNVVATAVGRYRIRREDSWPDAYGAGNKHSTEKRTISNSEVRPYSWPAVLVFVEEWVSATEFCHKKQYDPDQIVPKTLYLPDGRRVPVCVIEAPRELKTPPTPQIKFPLNNIGGGRPILAYVQGQEYAATIACLVTDGHKIFALTNHHVTGEAGEILYTQRQGRLERVGETADKYLTRIPFTELYPGFAGENTFVNLDIGLIDIDNLNDWTAQIKGSNTTITMGPLVNLSVQNMSLTLIGSKVRGYGSASGEILGEIHALFYRYKSQGGFDSIADFLIGPRTMPVSKPVSMKDEQAKKTSELPKFATHPGDSGTLYMLEPLEVKKEEKDTKKENTHPYLPLAMQWGTHMLYSGGSSPQSYALATCLSTVCNRLNVDLVRDWNIDQPETWGAIGHFSIASCARFALSDRYPKLVKLIANNASLMSPDEKTIKSNDFKGMGNEGFVHLADVPDAFWKAPVAHQGFTRYYEGPNHFADMDQMNNGTDLLTLCQDPKKIDPEIWNDFYDSVYDLLTEKKIDQKHRGLLPFRIWQIFDEMVQFAADEKRKTLDFVCAAGVLIHYVADACQPLHISYLHDGDPLRAVTRIHKRKGVEKEGKDALGKGIHSAYEDIMLNAHREDILKGLSTTPKVGNELIKDGYTAAQQVVELMRRTFTTLPPADIVQAYIDYTGKSKNLAKYLWDKFGEQTISVMRDGTHLVAVLWESAWANGDGNTNLNSNKIFKTDEVMGKCQDATFLESLPIKSIGSKLKRPNI